MEYITEKVAYLKGLAEGLELDTTTKEGKLLVKIVEVLDEMALSISELDNVVDELDSYVESLDEDLAEVEEVVYADDEDCCDCGCGDCDCDCDDELDGFECENCGHTVYLAVDDFEEDEEILCPNCNAPLFAAPEEE
jgi:hypothetical protein